MLGLKLISVLLVIILVSVAGTLVFMKGFLLTRNVIDAYSPCSPEFALRADDHTHHGVGGCWMHGRFKRAIVVIIDALKHDFMTFNESLPISKVSYEGNHNIGNDEVSIPYFKNKLPILHSLLQRKPQHCRLYKFMADPPTTTMQRLKGLTTGSLPTFVDAGANFHSYAITEDNLLHQMIRQGKKIKFLGDDTWLSLFPGKFFKSFAFPSFDVKDLHTVDNGILKHIYSELRQSNWDVTIAHFLGVDHCGHRYGPNHPAMADKLAQMNSIIQNITSLMNEDTILFIMGDHGMTRTGDHGGDSIDELEAGLFIYSPAQIVPDGQPQESVVSQTDFVPTVALLLGLPIPFSNLGMVIPELFGHCPWWDTSVSEIRRIFHQIKALRLNAHQVSTYLAAYQRQSSDLPASTLRSLQQQIAQAEKDAQSLVTAVVAGAASSQAVPRLRQLEATYRSYLSQVRQMCAGVWARFDLSLIVAGLVTLGLAPVLAVYFLATWGNQLDSWTASSILVLAGSSLHLLYLCVHMFLFPASVPPVMAVVIAGLLISACLLLVRNSCNLQLSQYVTADNIISGLVLTLNCCIYFSNSFIVHEDYICLFFMQSLIFVMLGKIVVNNYSMLTKDTFKSAVSRHTSRLRTNLNVSHLVTQPITAAVFLALTSCIVLRLTLYFRSCREEQKLCEDSIFYLPLSSVEEATRNYRYTFSVICLILMVVAFRRWLKHFGNLNGEEPGVLAVYYGSPLAALGISLHWAMQALPPTVVETFSKWQQVLMAQVVYVLILVALLCLACRPLMVYQLPSPASLPVQVPLTASPRNIIPTLYNQLKVKLGQGHKEEDKPPVVYGLGSVYSASLVAAISVVSLLLVLLLGDGMAPALLLATGLMFLCLELYSASVTGPEDEKSSHWSSVLMLQLMTSIFFFNTGHQTTIPSIRFEAAYTGFYGDFTSMILPGTLVWLNTFAGPILVSLACPLLVFWPLLSTSVTRWMLVKRGVDRSQTPKSWQGDFQSFDSPVLLRKNLFKVSCGMVLISSLKLLMAACAAALHRRHLMVWKIFAPRLIYEGALFLTTSFCVVLAVAFVLRVDRAVSKFISQLSIKKGS